MEGQIDKELVEKYVVFIQDRIVAGKGFISHHVLEQYIFDMLTEARIKVKHR